MKTIYKNEIFPHRLNGLYRVGDSKELSFEMANLTNLAIWEIGTPLSEAWIEFAAQRAKRQHKRCKNNISPGEIWNNRDFSDFNQNLQFLNTLTGNFMQISNIEFQMKKALIDQLKSKNLVAFGFRIFPTHSRKPVHIEAHKFQSANVDWAKGQMTSRGIAYAELRVIDSTQIENLKRPRPGPKGSGEAIRTAIAAIESEGFDICSAPRKIAFDKIRNFIGGNHPKGSGLTDANLSKYVVHFCGKREISN